MRREEWFDALRFPLIFMVVCIHAYDPVRGVDGQMHSLQGWSVVSDWFLFFLSNAVSRLAVPLFFLTSGYFFFKNIGRLDGAVWVSGVLKRVRTVVVPYFFWNLIVFFGYFYVRLVFDVPVSSDSRVPDFLSVSFMDGFLFVFGFFDYPIAYQFWFVRDLFVFFLASSVFLFLNDFSIYLVSVVFFFLWLFFAEKTGIPSLGGWVYFAFGVAAAKLGRGLSFGLSAKLGWPVFVLFLLFAICDFFVMDFGWYLFFRKIEVFLGVASVSFWAIALFSNARVSEFFRGLSGASFFVFAFHEPTLSILKKVIFVHVDTAWAAIFAYFLSILLTVSISLIVYSAVKCKVPNLISVLCGGR